MELNLLKSDIDALKLVNTTTLQSHLDALKLVNTTTLQSHLDALKSVNTTTLQSDIDALKLVNTTTLQSDIDPLKLVNTTTLQSDVDALKLAEERLAGVEKKVQCISPNSTASDLSFVGCDVHVEIGDSSGDTLSTNGKGNLVIGFNEVAGCGGGPGQCDRSGSHNLVLGIGNAYSASGGIVSGSDNTIDGDLAVLIGGQ
jgi:hypothetical protein